MLPGVPGGGDKHFFGKVWWIMRKVHGGNPAGNGMAKIRRVSAVKFAAAGVAALVAGLATAASQAATIITWQAPASVTSTSILDAIPTADSGATLDQSVYYGSDSTTYTVTTPKPQTISFTKGTWSGGAPSGSATELFYTGVQKLVPGTGVLSPNTGNASFDNVLENNGWASSAHSSEPQTLQIGGLTVGDTYAVQLFAFDGRSSSSARAEQYSDPSGDLSTSFSTYTNPKSVIGTFTATTATLDIPILQTTTGVTSWDTTISAFTLYSVPATVPEPATLGLLAVGSLGLLTLRRRTRA